MFKKLPSLEDIRKEFPWFNAVEEEYNNDVLNDQHIKYALDVLLPCKKFGLDHLYFGKVGPYSPYVNKFSHIYKIEHPEYDLEFEESCYFYKCSLDIEMGELWCPNLEYVFEVMSYEDREEAYQHFAMWFEQTDKVYQNLSDLKKDSLILTLSGF